MLSVICLTTAMTTSDAASVPEDMYVTCYMCQRSCYCMSEPSKTHKEHKRVSDHKRLTLVNINNNL